MVLDCRGTRIHCLTMQHTLHGSCMDPVKSERFTRYTCNQSDHCDQRFLNPTTPSDQSSSDPSNWSAISDHADVSRTENFNTQSPASSLMETKHGLDETDGLRGGRKMRWFGTYLDSCAIHDPYRLHLTCSMGQCLYQGSRSASVVREFSLVACLHGKDASQTAGPHGCPRRHHRIVE